MTLSSYIVWFAIASFAGWFFESLYAIVRTRRWERRGFLYGPACPIYGVGLIAAFLLFDRPEVASGEFPPWAVFLVSMICSAVLEYIVSTVLEKKFGAVWWDYSNLPLNINGRICLPASLLFGAAGTAIAYIVIPFAHEVSAIVPGIVFEASALIIVALLAADLTASLSSLGDLMDKIAAIDISANAYADEKVQQGVSALTSVPTQLRDKGTNGIESLKKNGAESARKVLGSIQEGRERVAGVAERLSTHQIRLLGKLRRFRSPDLRKKAALLRGAVESRIGEDEDDGAGETT